MFLSPTESCYLSKRGLVCLEARSSDIEYFMQDMFLSPTESVEAPRCFIRRLGKRSGQVLL